MPESRGRQHHRERVGEALKEEIERMLLAVERPFTYSGDAPLVIIMVGVNGVGKTTTVAKLAASFSGLRAGWNWVTSPGC